MTILLLDFFVFPLCLKRHLVWFINHPKQHSSRFSVFMQLRKNRRYRLAFV